MTDTMMTVQTMKEKALEVISGRKFRGDIFIIPNSVCKVGDYMGPIRMAYRRLIAMEAALPDFSEHSDLVVQVWTCLPLPGEASDHPDFKSDREEYDFDHRSYSSEELHGVNFRAPCDNFECHRGVLDLGDGWKAILRHNQGMLPVRCFEGLQEGDTVTIPYTCTLELWNRESEVDETYWDEDVIVPVEVTLRQTRYRYRDHGSFESLLGRLVAQAECRA